MNDEGIYESAMFDVVEKLGNSNIAPQDLLYERIGPISIEEYRKTFLEKKLDGCLKLLALLKSSIFEDFESLLRTEFDLIEDGISSILDEYYSILSLVKYH